MTLDQLQIFIAVARTRHARGRCPRTCDVNANPPGSHWTATPLHNAAIQGQTEIVALLLCSGADPQIRDRLHDATAFDWLEHARAPRRALLRQVAAMLANHARRTG